LTGPAKGRNFSLAMNSCFCSKEYVRWKLSTFTAQLRSGSKRSRGREERAFLAPSIAVFRDDPSRFSVDM
jgi:hypothetical protein